MTKRRLICAKWLCVVLATQMSAGWVCAQVVLPSVVPGTLPKQPVAPPGESPQARAQAITAADGGDAVAQLELGYAHFDPPAGTTPRYSEAFRWFARAAASGEPRAYLALGHLYAEGLGTSRNTGLARDYLERALDAGLPRAYLLLASALQGLPPSKRRDDPQQLLTLGLQANDGPSGNALGMLFEAKGAFNEAERAYRDAERLGSKAATQNIVRLGLLRDKLSRNSLARLNDRARLGDADAQYELAVRFHRGEGIPVNYGDAIRYYERSAAAGNPAAKRMLLLITSRPSATGTLNVAWMQELASGITPLGAEDIRATGNTPPVQEPNVLVGLLAMQAGAVEKPMEPIK